MKETIPYEQTFFICQDFYNDCLKFWKRESSDSNQWHHLALQDVMRIKTNPFSPNGNPLNLQAKLDNIEWSHNKIIELKTMELI